MQLPDVADHVGSGWCGIIETLHKRLLAVDPEYKVADLKEKYGMMRVYLCDETPEIWQLLADAEERSAKTCDECGATGKNFHDHTGWWMTKCRTHDPTREV